MIMQGRWRATSGAANGGHAGFRLNSLVSLLPNASWGKLAADFLAKKDDPERLKTFVNRFLAQGWRDDANALDEAELAARAEDFGLDKIPAEVIAMTAGCDVQGDRIEVTLIGWSKDNDAFVLAHTLVWGAPDDSATWGELDALLRNQWPHPYGGNLRIDATVIDSGNWTDRVYAFCFPRLSRRIMAGKGAPGARQALQMSQSKMRGGRVFLVGVDTIKASLFNRLARGKSIRFSNSLEPVFYEQLTAERKVIRYYRGRPITRWERKPGARAEALDCMVYAIAARNGVRIKIDEREDALKEVKVPPQMPRVIRSKWVEGFDPLSAQASR
jgi:phage terminase large subunit GpA-like protein